MPSLNLDQNILGASADASAGEWAQAAAEASLDFRGAAELKRGLNLEAGVGVMGELSGALRYFLAADVEASAQASARLKGQMQVPLDLFREAGFAVRLQAVAEAAASIRCTLGLSMREFLELAQQDDRIDSLAYDLLVIFLEELDIQAGVMGKAAFSAMAYVNLTLVGRLIEDSTLQLKPGFEISAEMGVGLEAGAGFQLFARLGFKDTRRLVGRSIDVLVDETIARLGQQLHDDYARSLVTALRAPEKIGLRCAFEVGHALYDKAPTFADNSGELARQCVRVALEEAQKALLEMLIRVVTDQFIAGFDELGLGEDEWNQARPQREAFANQLKALPREPFEPTAQNLAYWTALANTAINLGVQLNDATTGGRDWIESVSILWGAAQLMVASVEKIADADARASFFGSVEVTAQAKAFGGTLPGAGQAPTVVREHINGALDRPAGQVIDQDALVEYLLRDAVLELLLQQSPDAAPLIEMFAGPDADSAIAAAKVIMRNINAFVPMADGSGFDPKESLRIIAEGLEAYIGGRIQQELRPILAAELGDDPLVRMYIDEVILPSLLFTSNTLIRRTLSWGTGTLGARDALREACSSIVMKVLGRSAVVTADVLIAAALEQIGGELNRQADAVQAPGGIAHELAVATGTDEELVGEIISETLRIAADIYSPQPLAVRAKVRALMYDLLDTMPESADDNWIEQLQHDWFIPNQRSREAIAELAKITGEQLVDVMVRFLKGVVAKVAELVLLELAKFVEAVEEQIQEWIDSLAGLAADLLRRWLQLPAQIAALANEVNAHLDELLAHVESALGVFSTASGRSRLLGRMRDNMVATALTPLRNHPLYTALPAPARAAAENTMRSAISKVFQNALLPSLLQSLTPATATAGAVVNDLRSLLADLRTVDLDANLSAQVRNLLLDRLEQTVRAWWGGTNPGIDLVFQFSYTYTPPKVWGVTRWASVSYWPYSVPTASGWTQPADMLFHIDFSLGRIVIPLTEVVRMMRDMAADLTVFESAVEQIVVQLIELLEAEDAKAAAEAELDLINEQRAQVQQQLEETSAAGFEITILEPAPAALYESDLMLDVLLSGLPRSYLGFGALEPQRVFVFLNDEPLDLAGFAIRDEGAWDDQKREGAVSRGDSGWQEKTPAPDEPTKVAGRVDNAWVRSRITKAADDRESGHRDPRHGQADLMSTLARSRLKGAGSARLALGAEGRRAEHATMAIGRALGKRGASATETAASGDARLEHHFSFQEPMGAWLKSAFVADSAPGLRLSRTLQLSTLRNGINTLAVIVVSGGDARVARAVSFLAGPSSGMTEGTVRVGGTRLVHDHLPDDIRRSLGLTLTAAPERGETSERNESGGQNQLNMGRAHFWRPAKVETRQQTMAKIVNRQVEGIRKKTRGVEAVRSTVRDGGLRPQIKCPLPGRDLRKEAHSTTSGPRKT